jgi:hypothetical protein
MILYVNGDSHCYGSGVESNNTFAHHVATNFNSLLVNQAKSGASNQRIIRTTKEYLENNTPDLVLIGWSTWEREEWEYNGNYYNVNSSGHDSLPRELEESYKIWVTEQTSDLTDIKSQHWHQEIYKLHLDLQQKNIPHLFFNCMYNFFKINDYKDWNYNYVDPYNNDYSYYWFLKARGYDADDWYHFKADGHQAWGNFLIEYIENHDIICKR